MKKMIIANWKSNKTVEEAESWFEVFPQVYSELKDTAEIVVAPPFPLVPVVAQRAAAVGVKVGVQDMSQFDAGSYTGAISIRNLEGLAVEYAILGHSERRRYFHETHHDVAGKVAQAISAGIIPIVCVDEDYISAQAAAIEDDHLNKCIVAYEPLEAIGTGNNVDVGRVKTVSKQIKQVFGNVRVLYGGSTNSLNVSEYTLVVDGVLVGGASLDPKEFAQMVSKAA